MAERVEQDNLHSAINLRPITDFDCYALTPCSCSIDVKLTAPAYSHDGELRAPIDLIAVIDRSGSMQGQKLNLVLQVLRFVLIQLQSRDRFAIVAYDERVEEVVPLSHVEAANHLTSRAKIDQIQAGSSTNLSGGLIKGMNIMNERELKKADVASILLFTDGMANSGITDTRSIITAMENIYAGKKSFSVNTFGFGRDHNVHMLKEISRVGNGLYYFIQSPEQIPEIFTNCLGGLLSTVGQNISIAIETSNGATIKEFISTKEKPQLCNGNTKGEVSLGDIQSEEERDVILELSLPSASADSSSQPLSYGLISLKYFNVIKKDNDQQQAQLILDRRSDLTGRVPSVEVDEQKNRIKTIASLAEAAAMAEKGRLSEASRIITSQEAYISTSSSVLSPRVKSLTCDLNAARNSLKSERVYQNCGSSTLATLTDCHISQRSTGSRSYSTPSRVSSYSHYENTPHYAPDNTVYNDLQPLRIENQEIIQPDGLSNLPPKGAQQEELATPPPVPLRMSIFKRRSVKVTSSVSTPTPLPDYEKGPPYISEM